VPIHQHWRGRIHDTLRQRGTRLAADYIQRNLDRFDLLLPNLKLNREVVMHRRDISGLTNNEWSESSIGRFLNHLDGAGVLGVRNAGSRGLGLILKRDLTKSPFRDRQVKDPLQGDVEFDRMPTAQPVQPQQSPIPDDDDYCTNLSLDLTLAALDTVSQGLLKIDLTFAQEFSGQPAAKLYEAQEAIILAVRRLSQIRSAIGAGDDSDLEEIVGHSA